MSKQGRTFLNYCLVLLVLCVLGVAACKKNTPDTPSDPVTNNGDLKYGIDNLTDMTMERTGEISENIFVKKISGKLENVALNCINLPKGATAKFSPISIGLPSYNTIFTIKCVRTPAGVYDIAVRGSSESTGFTEFKLKLTVLPYANAADNIIGLFREAGLCTQTGGIGDTVNVEKVAGVNNRINIKGFWTGVWSNEVYADLDATTNTLVVPVQTTNGVSFSGTGTYDDDTMIIKYRVTGSTVDDTCSSTFSRTH